MYPHQFKRLLDILRSEFGAILKAIQEHTAATNQAKEAGREEWRQIPGIVSTVIDAKDRAQAERAKYEEDRRNDEQQPLIDSQERIAKWTKRACIAAACYGIVAFWQGCLMLRTARIMEEQTRIGVGTFDETRNALDTEQSHFDRTMKDAWSKPKPRLMRPGRRSKRRMSHGILSQREAGHGLAQRECSH